MTQLPPQVNSFLRTVRHRTNRLRWGRAFARVLFCSLAVLALAMAVDATLTIFNETVRWTLTGVVYSVAVGGLLGALIRLVQKRPTNTALAAQIDARHPELQERLTTLVDVATREAAGEETGASPALLALLAREAEEQVASYNARREVPLGRLFLWWLLPLALVALFVGAYRLRPKLTTCLAQRVLTPWVETGNLYADQLTVAPGDLTVLTGSNIVISVQTTGDFGHTRTIRISRWTGTAWDREHVSPMSEAGIFETVADENEPRWRYRVNCGPAVSRYYEVNVVPHPNYSSFVATVTWPDYTGRVPTVISNQEVSVVRAVVGSAVSFAVTAPPRVTPAFVLAGASETHPATNVWCWGVACAATNRMPWTLQMARRDEGFVEQVGVGRLDVFADQPPVVAVQAPQEANLVLPPRSPLPLVFTASDDFGLASAELRVAVAGTTNEVLRQVLKMESLGGASRRLAATLDFTTLSLDAVRDLEITAIVRDTRAAAFGGAQAATSMPICVHLDQGAQDLARQELDQRIEQMQQLARTAREELERATNQANELRQDVRHEHGAFNESAEEKLAELTKSFESAQEKMSKLVRTAQQDEKFESFAAATQQTLDKEMDAAARQVQQAQPSTENKAERAQAANQMPEAMKAALTQMRQMEKKLGERSDAARQLSRLESLSDRQDRLAQQAEAQAQQTTPQQDQQQWRQNQESLGHETGRISWRNDTPELAEAARQMHAAARRSRDEASGREPDEKNQQQMRQKTQQRLEELSRNLNSARERREEAAQIEAEHEKRDAHAAQQNASQEKRDGQTATERSPYSDQERTNLERLHHDAREHERRAAQLAREAADSLMSAEAKQTTRQALGEAIEQLYQERKHAERAHKEFQQTRWDKRRPAPKGQNAELAQELRQVAEKVAAAEEVAKKETSEGQSNARPGSSAQAARAAANALQQAVARKRSEMGMKPGAEGDQPSSRPGQFAGRPAPLDTSRMKNLRVQPVPANLRGLVSPEEWIRIRAVLGESDAVETASIPEEYRELVKRYFQILAGER